MLSARPSARPSRSARLVYGLLASWALTLVPACASAPTYPSPLIERRGALGDLREALVARARTPEERALLARLDEAFDDEPRALEGWIGLLEVPGLAAWAELRLTALVDRVPLERRHLEALLPHLPRTAPLVRQVAYRLADPAAYTRALTTVRYRPSSRLVRWPGPTEAAPATEAGLLPTREAPEGQLLSPEEGPGLYAFRLELPPRHPSLVVHSEGAVRALAVGPEQVRVLHDHPALSRHLPTTFRIPLDLVPDEQLELHVVDRAQVVTVRVELTEPAPFAPATTSETGRAVALLGALDLALASGDSTRAADLAAELPPDSALGALASGELVLADRTLPPDIARARATSHFERALGLEPTLHEARRHLVGLVLEDDPRAALRLLAPWAPTGPGLGLHPERASALALSGDEAEAEAIAAYVMKVVPTSCRALELRLDTGWERLRYQPTALAAILPAPLLPPAGCVEARLRQIDLLREAHALDAADALLAPLTRDAGVGLHPARGRALVAAARIALARGAWAAAASAAARALDDGGAGPAARELLTRARRLEGSIPSTPAPTDRLADLRPRLAALARRPPPGPEAGGTAVLFDERRVEVLPDGAQRVRVHRLVRPLDAQAVERVGELPLPDDAEVLLARTWKLTTTRGQRARELTPIEPEEILEKATISLPSLAVGDCAEWAYTYLVPPDPRIAPGWSIEPFPFDSEDGPVDEARFVLELAPGARAPTFVVDPRVPPPERVAAESGRPARWIFAARDLSQHLGEPLDPTPDARRQVLRAHSGLDLHAWAPAEAAELALLTRPTPAIADLVARASASAPEGRPLDVLRAAYDLLRATIEEPVDAEVLGPGSSPASWIAVRGRGARATLLLAVCRELGLACELVLARPLWQGPPPLHPDPRSHAYPLVHHPASDTWLDPSGRWNPWNLLPPALAGVSGLALPLASTHAPRLLSTPPLDLAAMGRRVAHIDITLDSPERYRATGEESLDGAFAASWRTALTALQPEARSRILASIVNQALPTAAVDGVTLEHLEDDHLPLVWRWTATGQTQASGRGVLATHQLGVALFPEGLARGTVVLSERETPLFVDRAVRLDLTVRVTAPPGYGFPAAPRDLELTFDTLRLERRSTFEDGGRVVVIDKRFALAPTILEPSRYAAWSDAAQAVDRADLVQLTLARGGLPTSAPEPRGATSP